MILCDFYMISYGFHMILYVVVFVVVFDPVARSHQHAESQCSNYGARYWSQTIKVHSGTQTIQARFPYYRDSMDCLCCHRTCWVAPAKLAQRRRVDVLGSMQWPLGHMSQLGSCRASVPSIGHGL